MSLPSLITAAQALQCTLAQVRQELEAFEAFDISTFSERELDLHLDQAEAANKRAKQVIKEMQAVKAELDRATLASNQEIAAKKEIIAVREQTIAAQEQMIAAQEQEKLAKEQKILLLKKKIARSEFQKAVLEEEKELQAIVAMLSEHTPFK